MECKKLKTNHAMLKVPVTSFDLKLLIVTEWTSLIHRNISSTVYGRTYLKSNSLSNVQYKKSKMLYYRTQKPKYVTLNQRKTKFALCKTKCFQIWQCLIFKADNKYSSPGTVAIAGGSNGIGKKRLSMTYRKVTIYLYYSYSHEYF